MSAVLGLAWAFLRGMSPLTWALALAAAGALAAIGVQHYQIGRLHRAVKAEQQALQKEQRDRADERTRAATAALAASNAYRALETTYRNNVVAAEATREKDREINARIVADLRGQLDGVRRQLAAFATGGRAAADDTVAACRDRADALGRVLAEALRVQGELAADAEDRAADARSLLDAWPRRSE